MVLREWGVRVGVWVKVSVELAVGVLIGVGGAVEQARVKAKNPDAAMQLEKRCGDSARGRRR